MKRAKDLKLFVPERRKSISRRNDRLASQMRECFSMAIIRGDFHGTNTAPAAQITITYIDLSPDLKSCVVYFTSRCDEAESLDFLASNAHYFKDVVAKKMSMKAIPNIKFRFDNSIEESKRIDQLLSECGTHNVRRK